MKNICDFPLTTHASDQIHDRKIRPEWVERTLKYPDFKRRRKNGRIHYLKRIPEHAGYYLRVVVDGNQSPRPIVTVYFDSNPINLP